MTQPRRILSFAVFVAAVLLLPRNAAAQKIYVTSRNSQSITVIESSTNTVLATIPTPGHPGLIVLTPDAKFAYVINDCNKDDTALPPFDPGSVSAIDLVNNTIVGPPIAVGNCPVGIAVTPNGNEVYVSNRTDRSFSTTSPANNSVYVIQTSTNTVSTTIPNVIPPGPSGQVFPSALAISPDGTKVYVASPTGSTTATAVIDTALKTVGTPMNIGGIHVSVSPGGEVWESQGSLLVVGSRAVLNGNNAPWGWCTAGPVVFSADGTVAYLLDSECGGITKIAVSNLAPLGVISDPNAPNSPPATMTISPDGKHIYEVTNIGNYPNPPIVLLETVDTVASAYIGSVPVPITAPNEGIAVAPMNTPVGPGPTLVQPNDLNGGGSPVSVTFTGVTQEGFTSLRISPSGPPAPTGFSFGNPPIYYDISTTAIYSSATVCITAPTISGTARLLHYSGNPPTAADVTAPGYPNGNMICSVPLTSLSPFAIGQPAGGSATATSLSASSVTYGTAASVTVSVASAGGGTSGNVTLSVDGGAAMTAALSGGSALFNLGVVSAGNHSLSANFAAQGSFLGSSANGTLTVTQAPLTLTADNKSKVYGAALPALSFSASGFVNGDTAANLTTQPTLSTIATAASGVGSYPITISGAVDANYAISYVQGTLTVTPAVLTITATSLPKVLDAPNPPLPWTATGFVNGDNTSALTTSPTCTTAATTTSPVGSYPINCSSAVAANYTISYVAGTLKIFYATAIGHVIQPPINADGSSVYKQGRTVPAKFAVYDANGVSIGTPGVVTSFFLTAIVSGTTTTTVEDVVDTNNPDTAFRWDGQEWIFNITTGNLTAGSTYIYTITLNDGSTIVFQFGLR